MLFHQASLDTWLSNRSPMASIRIAQLTDQKVESGSFLEGAARQSDGSDFERRGNVAVIHVVGALQYRFDIMSYLYGSDTYTGITAKVAAATADESIQKIILAIDSPGGTHHGVIEASDAVFAARERKEVVAVVDPMAASAGYWLASQATRIVCLRSGWVGSVGSQVVLASMHKAYQMAGIDVELIRASIGPNKNLGNQFEPINDEARAERQGWVDTAGEQFLEHVVRGRGISRDAILESYGQGIMCFADEALSRGMIDRIGSLAYELA